ncbi:maltodextrin glucosidase [Edwardsiella ictaluri]|uniref:maltodextrin glucosidase n=1 Tax=Edwardsiella ictaluri TaxID=67780 RepID=UPI00065D5379|nr:maltodextrin glucosidase [Edwardsiella ictaluri]ELV7527935.1 maltodextrin glucosidase [Edwardsiella ictaluri]KMQ79347.1 maltodextrin glucosidase [Edwardsiella ictaluri]KOO55987.1 maltodextrin glucosidase [Edwardsiella ictaluri]
MFNAWHLPAAPYVRRRGDDLVVTLLLAGEDLPQRVLLRCEPDNEEWLLPMRRHRHRAGVCYRARLSLREGEPLRRYCFKLLWDDRQRWLTPLGLQETPPGQEAQFAVSVPSPYPEWVADQVFYQIFPDRFARSAVAENAPHPRWRDWVTPLDDTVDANTFYGGDLDGITARLPYLQALGITALYLNPIFSAPSNHKYDTADYYRVDAGLGGDQALIRLRQATARVGIRLLLDGVFNHTGDTHRWFDRPRCGEDGACHHPASPQRERYSFDADGRALGWKGEPSLPKLDYASVRVIDSIYRADDSVIRYWLRPPYAIDGWRLDVIHMLGEGGSARGNLHHLAEMYRAVKAENPQAYVLGEHFGDARRWLQAGVEDGAMNYMGFALPLRAFLAGVDVACQPIRLRAEACASWMESYRAGLSQTQQLCQFNQLDSHDTARFITLLRGNRQRMMLALTWLFTWIGVPCLYYGDEIGLAGENDPYCRAPFPWETAQWDGVLHSLCHQLAQMRRRYVALRRGACQVIHADGETLLFIRRLERQSILVAIQRTGEGEVSLPCTPLLPTGAWRALCGAGRLAVGVETLTLRLPAESASVWALNG